MGIRTAYECELATLYAGDCRDAVEMIEAKSVGLMVADPPYGWAWESSRRTKSLGKIANDNVGDLDIPKILGSYMRTMKPRRHVYVFGFQAEQLAGAMKLGGTADLIWDKGMIGMGDLKRPWGPQHEPIAFGVYTPSKANRDAGDGALAARMRKGSVLRVDRPNAGAVSIHPTQKPIALCSMLIESSSVVGDVVLDPFAGSGSTLVAAILLGRRAIGVELDAKHIDVAIGRIKEAERIAALIRAA